MVKTEYSMRVSVTVSLCIDRRLPSSWAQSSRYLKIALGWQKIPKDSRLVSDDFLEKCSAKFMSVFC